MAIEIPEQDLLAVADLLRNRVLPTAENAESAAKAADSQAPGIIHQGAASKVEAVAQKLAGSDRLCGGAAGGTADGLKLVVQKFGELDKQR